MHLSPPRLRSITPMDGSSTAPRPLSSAFAIVAAFVAAGLVIGGCDQFNAVVDKNADKLNVPIETEQVVEISVDIGAASGALAGQKAPDRIEQTLPLPPVDVDLNKESKALADNKGLIKRLEIVAVTVTPTTNTVTAALPKFELRIGAFGSTAAKDAFRIATIPAIPSKSTAVVDAVVDVAGTDAAQAHLLALAFSQHTVATMVVEKGADVPDGKADLKITMKLKATLNPL